MEYTIHYSDSHYVCKIIGTLIRILHLAIINDLFQHNGSYFETFKQLPSIRSKSTYCVVHYFRKGKLLRICELHIRMCVVFGLTAIRSPKYGPFNESELDNFNAPHVLQPFSTGHTELERIWTRKASIISKQCWKNAQSRCPGNQSV